MVWLFVLYCCAVTVCTAHSDGGVWKHDSSKNSETLADGKPQAQPPPPEVGSRHGCEGEWADRWSKSVYKDDYWMSVEMVSGIFTGCSYEWVLRALRDDTGCCEGDACKTQTTAMTHVT